MTWDELHKNDNSKPICYISKEAAALFSDDAIIGLLIRKGVDVRRKTRITEEGAVYYND